MKLKKILLKGQIEGLRQGTTVGRLESGEHEKRVNDPTYGWTLVPGPHWVECTNRDGRKYLVPWSMVNNPPEVIEEAVEPAKRRAS